MKKAFKVLGWSLLVLLLVGAYAGYRIVWGDPFTLRQLANRQALFFLVRNPELFSNDRRGGRHAARPPLGRLAPVGPEKIESDYAFGQRALAEVKRFDRAKLARQDQITYDILLDFYGTQAQFHEFEWLSSEGLYPISPMFRHAGAARELHADHPRREEPERPRATTCRACRRWAASSTRSPPEMQRQSAAGVVLAAGTVSSGRWW